MLREKSCGAVVFLKQESQVKYLLLNYSVGRWDFVKGGVEPDESEKETVIRELKEETNITDARFIDGFREPIAYFYRKNCAAVHKIVVFYLMETCSERVELSYEHEGYVWLDYEQAIKKISFANAKAVLEKAHSQLVRMGIVKKQPSIKVGESYVG
ncbi:MAG: NUDIX domain-containing protein [Candidatus Bathyarchaeota archaeon]|nr:NUDIX domain-containing protein [Candidatus Bathyarchaeota archaeon]